MRTTTAAAASAADASAAHATGTMAVSAARTTGAMATENAVAKNDEAAVSAACATAAVAEATASGKAPTTADTTAVTELRTAQAPFAITPSLRLSVPEGEFVATERTPKVSSKRKLVYRGIWRERSQLGARKSAVAIVFVGDDIALYGAEVAALARNELLGVGPAPYLVAASVLVDGAVRPVIIEEDAGVSLEAAVFDHASVPSCPDEAMGRASGVVGVDGSDTIGVGEARDEGDGADGTRDGDVGVDEAWDEGAGTNDSDKGESSGRHLADNPKGRPLSPIGTSEREQENAKILFDVYTQVKSLHDAGFFHRDIRLANVCIRRFGNRPQDIRAFLVDHELATTYQGKDVPASAQSYERTLFRTLPRAAARMPSAEQGSPGPFEDRRGGVSAPTSLMRDLGYLAALRIELETEKPIDQAHPDDFASTPRSFFRYTADGNPVVHALSCTDDIEPLAKKAQLTPVDIDHFFNPTALDFAQTHLKHGGYADARDLAMLTERTPIVPEGTVERIAREAVYPKWVALCHELGREPEYPDFDSQPQSLQESNRAQVRDIARKMGALGYRIVPESCARREEIVRAFSDEEIDYLAYLEHQRWMEERLATGWTWGQARNDDTHKHPDLVPYDSLSPETSEYDKSAVREIPTLLAKAGLAICR